MVWIAALRGLFALGLGAAELVVPDAIRPMVVNFLGLFLLTGGLAELRAPAQDGAARALSLAASWAAIVAGAAVLARFLLLRIGPEVVVVYLLAGAVFVAGALHIAIGRRWWEERGAVRSCLNIGLGAIELTLGALLIAAPLERGAAFHGLLTAWALLAGSLLLMKAWATCRGSEEEIA